jgi:peptide deformylase
MIREIVELGNPLLRTVSRPVTDPTGPATAALARDLLATLHDIQRRTGYGRGIAAPQIGMMERMVVIGIPREKRDAASLPEGRSSPLPSFPLVLINPVISERSPETTLIWDACFSYWGFFFQVARARRVTVEYHDLAGLSRRLQAEGDLAELLQHEIDHLDGVLAIDLIADPRSLCTVREYERRAARAAGSG